MKDDPAHDAELIRLSDLNATFKRLYNITPPTPEFKELRIAYFASLARYHHEIQQRIRSK